MTWTCMDAHSQAPHCSLPPPPSPLRPDGTPHLTPSLSFLRTWWYAEEASQRRALREEQRAAQAGQGTGDLQADGTWDLSNDDQQFVSTTYTQYICDIYTYIYGPDKAQATCRPMARGPFQ